MKYLVRTVETYRVANEAEAKKVIEEAKADRTYTLSKYSSEYKCTKAKGEVVDEWYRVILTKYFNIEKEPDKYVEVNYSAEIGYFPDPVTKEENESENESDEVPF
jgi:hypothetical protein